ncbi:thioredoxin domain-containing protein [Micromonospora sp. HM5-17]|jgi:protein-disulfide isomerase|uniref:DsbA family protein n=1 Tax=Micromonospora sp. HM5-17 TaxID=2487710 RepID=UPI000F473D74|nr:thioredoxin domain-containing protein [Micromonospora sp. HM5-17]ROT31755.1 disulfide bond formation protein DsbA [Micromonospora sp. HM5-17]
MTDRKSRRRPTRPGESRPGRAGESRGGRPGESRAGRADSRAARVIREQRARERRRRRALWTSIGAVVVLVAAGLIGWGVTAARNAGDFTPPDGANPEGTGIVVGSGPVTIDIYEDFLCPFCKQFEQQASGTLDQLIAQGRVRVTYHPVAFLNRFSSTDYSTRSSAASGCAAQSGKFREYARALFDRQPPEGGAGLSDDELVEIAVGVGLSGDSFRNCVRENTFKKWTDHVTEEASRAGITGTPTVLVNGKQVQASAEAITAAVTAAGG